MSSGELQIQIDDVLACAGNCPGCVLSVQERKSTLPDMRQPVLQQTIERLLEWVETFPQLEKVNITYAIADHLLMGEDYLQAIYEKARQIILAAKPLDTRHSSVFFTTSLVGKPDVVIEKLNKVHQVVSQVDFLPIVVLAPALLHAGKFGPIYREMIMEARKIFGKVDLSINLSDDAIREMSPDELMSFAQNNAFDEVTVNWTPNLINAKKTCEDIPATRQWLLDFNTLLRGNPHILSSFRPVMMKAISSMCRANELPLLKDVVENVLPETIRHSIEIDHRGHLMPKFEAIGDIPYMERFTMQDMGSLERTSIQSAMDEHMGRIQRNVLSLHANRQCQLCQFVGLCAGTGFHVINSVLKKTNMKDDGPCPHVAQAIFQQLMDASA